MSEQEPKETLAERERRKRDAERARQRAEGTARDVDRVSEWERRMGEAAADELPAWSDLERVPELEEQARNQPQVERPFTTGFRKRDVPPEVFKAEVHERVVDTLMAMAGLWARDAIMASGRGNLEHADICVAVSERLGQLADKQSDET